MIGKEVAKYFEASTFIDVEQVKKELHDYRTEFYEYRKLAGW